MTPTDVIFGLGVVCLAAGVVGGFWLFLSTCLQVRRDALTEVAEERAEYQGAIRALIIAMSEQPYSDDNEWALQTLLFDYRAVPGDLVTYG